MSPQTSSGHILIADDDKSFLNCTAGLLRQEGYDCDCVLDAPVASQRIAANQYDLLIADIHMPGNSNLELVRSLSQTGLPVLLVTGYPSLGSAVESVGLSVVGYLIKPFVFKDLMTQVRGAIARSQIYRLISKARQRLLQLHQEMEASESLKLLPGLNATSVPLDAFLELTLRNINDCLKDLASLTTTAVASQNAQEDVCKLANCPRADILSGAIEETIQSLKKTKNAFRSKELAELRRKLEELIGTET